MKRSILILVLSFVSFSFAWSQTVVTIGTGTSGTLYGPVYIYSNTSPNTHSWYLAIYNPAEIIANGGGAGMITGVSWYKSDAGGYLSNDASFEIYIKSTTLSDFSAASGNFDVESTNASLAYSSTTAGLPASTGWVDYAFTNPFLWNGTDNIMILSRWVRTGTGTNAVNWASTSITPDHVSTSFNSSATMGSLYSFANRPNIKLHQTLSVSVEEFAGISNRMFLYPNPVKNKLSIVLPDAGNARITVRSVTGSVVKEELNAKVDRNKEFLLNTESFHAGIYFLEVVLPERVYKAKFVKKKD